MGATKREFEKLQFEDILGEEARVYHKWLEEEEYNRYQPKPTERYYDKK
tara:strand:- start:2004 stop:2150 length:147 start_codon:yes stop_codon:yes gene_type:complete